MENAKGRKKAKHRRGYGQRKRKHIFYGKLGKKAEKRPNMESKALKKKKKFGTKMYGQKKRKKVFYGHMKKSVEKRNFKVAADDLAVVTHKDPEEESSGVDVPGTSQEFERSEQQFSTQPNTDSTPHPINVQCPAVIKTELTEYAIDSGTIVKPGLENEGYESSHSSHTSHVMGGECAGQPHFGEQCHSSIEEPFVDAPTEVERLCRLCLEELKDFAYIFEFDDVHMFNIGDVINDLLGMDLNPDDGYPTKICNACLEELAHFRRFKGKCFKSNAKLKELIGDRCHYDDSDLQLGDDGVQEKESDDIPVTNVMAEGNPGNENDCMFETSVKNELPDSCIGEEMGDIESRSGGIDFAGSHLLESVVGSSQGYKSDNVTNVGKGVTVKKQYLMVYQPMSASSLQDVSPFCNVTVSDIRHQPACGIAEKSETNPASSSESPAAISSFPPIKEEMLSDDEDFSVKQDYPFEGGLAS